ncbi:EscU/YscU/HrcU family type III secretion system export apparatus switch protein [Curtobacterium flaccumfaciens pv. flaccumfaciens]|uniref:EscU/YscU/HrcU family type III secretion system export apparatus switch protein n=1 Tax=Curtobacterium flaccumfaciens TaxID=2035 RepID=UPI00188DA769|nr:EscU/YscU/HrcU family type III secretion system export apparatus switch protein [Curtobacterium flaccumfaciens]MBF4628653.1 EscU/YscU/HrcU family type III secretion system export apparatus switch protein [Curtobacterium flaccumfaciens]MBT1668112.1 flagellar type III secretion system protein FlhB [Curtobacterium flaccumfaciens pv. flaccumfaciens]MCS6558864.1 EscU/YscU/HrcU family type III secretion system export apparatus switch protein [Curtobacterium flaccumfaciens]QYI97817.1 EscU/YscU/HrcU
MSDSGERSEQATQQRMREVHEKGQIGRSQDLGAWIGIAVAALMIPAAIGNAAAAGQDQLLAVQRVIEDPELGAVQALLADALGSMGATLGPMLAVVAVAVLAAAVTQGGVHFRKMTPQPDHFDPIAGLKRVFGTQALWNGAKALLKTAVVGLVLWFAVQGLMPVLMTSGSLPLSAVLEAAAAGSGTLLRAAIVAGLVLAALDVFVVIRRNRKRTMMTKREVKDENKRSDGDPLVKSQRRSRQLAMSRNRMIQAIGTADVVMTNPTHYAVAIKYEPGKSAPRVVAKGAGPVADVIRARAEEERVPIVRDVPLTRALHAACELGHEIPVDLYTPVARVLSFVMALKARGTAAGTHAPPRPTTPDEVASVIDPATLTGDLRPRRLRTPRTAENQTEGLPA